MARRDDGVVSVARWSKTATAILADGGSRREAAARRDAGEAAARAEREDGGVGAFIGEGWPREAWGRGHGGVPGRDSDGGGDLPSGVPLGDGGGERRGWA